MSLGDSATDIGKVRGLGSARAGGVDWLSERVSSVALLLLVFTPDRAERILAAARTWLERHARTVAGVLVIALAAALLRNGISGLVS